MSQAAPSTASSSTRRALTAAATGTEDLSTLLAQVSRLADPDPDGLGSMATASVSRIATTARRVGAHAVVHLVSPPTSWSPASGRHQILATVVTVTGAVEVVVAATPSGISALPLTELVRSWPSPPDAESLGRAAPWAGPVITTLLARLEHTLRGPGTDPTRPAAGSEPPDLRLVLVPDGVLGLVPWHAALLGRSPSRFACERVGISYASCAAALDRGTAGARRPVLGQTGRVTVIADPAGQPRPWTGLGAPSISTHVFPQSRLWGRVAGSERSRVSPQDLLELLGSGGRLVDLGGPARSDVDPDRAGLALAGGWLSASTLLEGAARRARSAPCLDLMVLSGCATPIGVAEHDPALGLPEALLAAGTRGVVATRWSVPDPWAATLGQIFHAYLAGRMPDRSGPLDSLRALAAAQRWFLAPGRRQPTWLDEMFDAVICQLDDPTSGEPLVCWAAFAHHGVGPCVDPGGDTATGPVRPAPSTASAARS